MEIIIAIAGALIKGLFSVLGMSMESSAKSEAKAANARADQAIESVETEREIEKSVHEVPEIHVDPNDIFGAAVSPDPDPVM
jgi:hypothetical protein